MDKLTKREFCNHTSKYLKEAGIYTVTNRGKDEFIVTIEEAAKPTEKIIPKIEEPVGDLPKAKEPEGDFLDEAEKELEEARKKQDAIAKRREFLLTHYQCGCAKRPAMNLCPIHGRM